MRVIFTLSWGRRRQWRPCDFECSSMGNRRVLIVVLTLTKEETDGLQNSGCIN